MKVAHSLKGGGTRFAETSQRARTERTEAGPRLVEIRLAHAEMTMW